MWAKWGEFNPGRKIYSAQERADFDSGLGILFLNRMYSLASAIGNSSVNRRPLAQVVSLRELFIPG
jgi:hypothetical protein